MIGCCGLLRAEMVDWRERRVSIPSMTSSQLGSHEAAGGAGAIDMLVLATINASYQRSTSAANLADDIAAGEVDERLVQPA